MRALGYEIEAGKDSLFEIKGVSHDVIRAFSERAAQVEARLAERGQTRETASAEEKQIAALDTREAKETVERVELVREWRATADAAGLDQEARPALVEAAKQAASQVDLGSVLAAQGVRASKKPARTRLRFPWVEPPLFGWRAGGARPCKARQGSSPGTIRRSIMQNIAEFQIIGRIGKIDPAKDVTHLSVAANYNRRDGNEWKSDPHWNRVTLFGKLRDRLAKAATGDLVRITGRVRQTSYEAEGTICYGVDMIADGFAILAKASGKPADEDAGE